MSRSSMFWSLLVLALVFAGCGGGSGDADEPSTGDSTSPPAVDSSGSETEPSAATESEDTRDPSELTEAPETVAPAPVTAEPTPEEPEPAPVEQPPDEPDPGEPLPVLEDSKIPRNLESFVTAARADLAATLGVGESEIAVAVAETIVWPDGSLGCPEPGMSYTQVQVEGFRIVLTNSDSSYSYHGGGSRPDPFLCRNPSFPSS